MISEIVRVGGTVCVPIRMLMGWFGYSYRGALINRVIRDALKECEIETDPDFADGELPPRTIVRVRSLPQRGGARE